MSDLLIKNMEMPPTGVYIASVDNSDKNRPVLLLYLPDEKAGDIVAYKEMISVPPHGRLIDADKYEYPGDLADEPTVIPASK